MEQQGTAPQGSVSRMTACWARSRWFVPALVATVLLRLRFFFTPMTADEGGQMVIARTWSRGAVLYKDIFIDRPVGMMALFRAMYWLGLGNRFGLRLLALVLCLVGSAGCGRIAARLGSESSAAMAAFGVGLLLSVPRLDGFPVNGELLSCSVGAVGLACVLRACWGRVRPQASWAFLGGLAGGLAIILKQSGFDALGAGVLALLFVSIRNRWSWRDRARGTVSVAAGALVPIGLMLLHAALTGWERWRYALIGYRSSKLGLFAGAEWGRLRWSARVVGPVVILAVAVVVLLMLHALRRKQPDAVVLFVVWVLFGSLAFLLGGLFFVHYWLILMFPLGTAVAVFVDGVESSRFQRFLFGLAMIAPLLFTIFGIAKTARETEKDPRQVANEQIAAWFKRTAGPGDKVLAQCTSPALYAQIPADPPFKYLWARHIDGVEGAANEYRAFLSGPDIPKFIAVFQPPDECDPSGIMQQVLDTRYTELIVINGVPIYERKPGA
ncbi:MAG: hypothetical protein F2934_05860 [Actinobacteria bacterium]|nr:hypothetical protein [Actinomycetota bacterium]MSZ04432.1 hypothetical protein [Actinomycetota bacterium]MTB06639.1 hypothetical protein [Actinomycetota bacterium]